TRDPWPMARQNQDPHRRSIQAGPAQCDRVIVVRQSWFGKSYTAEEAAHMWHGGVGKAWEGEVSTYFAFDLISSLMKRLDARAIRVAEALQVEQVPLPEIVKPSLEYYYDWLHLTPAGAKIVADAVADVVLRR